ncbi:MAG TPA: hypothetical protein VHJ76_08660 [Actinomycetota bacterium]|nr:hypothetical protein [Actinomycetota bacterium]
MKALLLVSVLTGAFGLVAGATPAHACTAEFPSTACVWHDVCMVAGPKIGPRIGC